MGLKHSSSIADAVLYVKGQKDYAAMPLVQEQHGIVWYLRFRDDLLIVGNGEEFTGSFIWGIKDRVSAVF